MANDTVAQALDDLKATVTDLDTVVASNNAQMDLLGEFMRTHANDAAAIREMGDRLITDKQSLSDALTRNTPADPNAGGGTPTTDPNASGGTPSTNSPTPGNTAGQPNNPRR